MKAQIVEELGESELLLPRLIAAGLAANDAVKVRLSVLQAAARIARGGGEFELSQECRQVGLDEAAMRALVERARLTGESVLDAPGLAALLAAVWGDVDAMVRAVAAGARTDGMRARFDLLRTRFAAAAQDTIALADVASLTAIAQRGDGDTLHRLVMDLHKALNALAAAHAEEVFAGAHVHGLLPDDRPAVAAFMRGVESTRKLKFDHPGLATTAGRSGNRLTIQNDIGETDAHVLVVTVEGNAVTVTYTDVHLPRARFFTGLFGDFPVTWSGLDRRHADGLGDDGVFYLVTGRFNANVATDRDAFLETIGAALVFLIDWNKARKLLRNWISKADAVRVLEWGARNRHGHRALLELGGAELVAAAVHHAAPARIGFGERLDTVLGRDGAIGFLKTVLRVSAEALLGGGSARLARDRIEADLVRRLKRLDSALLATVVRQAGLARDIAAALADLVTERQARRTFDVAQLAARARRIEEKADRIAIDAREEIVRCEADPAMAQMVNSVEDAIDALEQAAFIASVAPQEIDATLLAPLADLCAAAVSAAEATASAAAAAADVPDGKRVDADDALAAAGRLMEIEHAADAAERTATAAVLRGDFDLKAALSVLEFARAVEDATDRFAAFGHVLRAHILKDLSG